MGGRAAWLGPIGSGRSDRAGRSRASPRLASGGPGPGRGPGRGGGWCRPAARGPPAVPDVHPPPRVALPVGPVGRLRGNGDLPARGRACQGRPAGAPGGTAGVGRPGACVTVPWPRCCAALGELIPPPTAAAFSLPPPGSARAGPRRCGLHGRALPCQSLGEFSLPHQPRRTGLGTERGCVGAQEPEQLVNLVYFIGNPHSWLWNLSLYACGAGATLDRGLFVLTSLPRRQQYPVW